MAKAMRLVFALLFATCVSALNVVPRRQMLQAGAAAVAALAVPGSPASAKSKSSALPNKPEGVGANAGQYLSKMRKEEYAAISGDKGTRGVASSEFEKNDTVQRNRDKNGGLAKDANGYKIIGSNVRNRGPEELGLKQWDGN